MDYKYNIMAGDRCILKDHDCWNNPADKHRIYVFIGIADDGCFCFQYEAGDISGEWMKHKSDHIIHLDQSEACKIFLNIDASEREKGKYI